MDLGLEGRVVLVTGGTSGVGLETARILLGDGARVVVCGRDAGRLEAAVETLGGGDRLLGVRCDVLIDEDLRAMREAALARFGALDVLIANAGQGRVSTFAETSDEDWRAEFELKLFSVVRPVRRFLPDLKAGGAGAVVVVNSLLARQPEPHMVCTSAARAAVQNLVKSMSVEFAPEVRVNSILIGTVNSGQWARRYEKQARPGQSFEDWLGDLARDKAIPLGRMGRPEEAASAVVFLASPAAGFITGAALEVAGGVSRFA